MYAIANYIESLRLALNHLPVQPLEETTAIVTYARMLGNNVFFMDNGSSGSAASHFASDLDKAQRSLPDLPRFKVFPLNDPMPPSRLILMIWTMNTSSRNNSRRISNGATL